MLNRYFLKIFESYPIKENLSSNIFPINGKGFSTLLAALIIPIIISTKGIMPNIPKIPILVTINIILRMTDNTIEKKISPKDCFRWYFKKPFDFSFPITKEISHPNRVM